MLVLALLTACDLSVQNPGPVADEFLSLAAAHQAVANGAGRFLANAIASGTSGSLGFDGAAITREIHPGGQTGSFGISPQLAQGFITSQETGGSVDEAQGARWVAEDGARRIREALPAADFAKSPIAATILLYAGFANRLLGEGVCETVIDGGPIQPYSVHFTRAEAAFTEAIAIARAAANVNLERAALSGRASVRIWLGNWDGAVADAALVPKTFRYQLNYNNLDREQLNSFWFSVNGTTFRNVTVWSTWYAANFDEFKDPRTAYATYPQWRFAQGQVGDLGDGRGELGQVLFYQQRKHTSEAAPIDVADGREMQLIIAERMLRTGDMAGALTIINDLRRDAGVTARTATTIEQAWTWLKLEKLIELWLEGRAMGERRRWDGAGRDPAVPGPLPALLRMDDRRGKDKCFPISQQEKDTNPNLQS
jgi:hypothetical protein